MTPRGLVAAMLAPGVALALWAVLGAALFLGALGSSGTALRVAAGAALETHGMVLILWWLGTALLGAWLARRLYRTWVLAPSRLLAATRILAAQEDAVSLPDAAPATPATRALAAEIESLARDRNELRAEMAQLVEQASRSVAEQRDQLATLMDELDHAVVVCNRDGRILLFNARMRRLARNLSPQEVTELVGLGRSIHAVLDPAAIAHALETVDGRIARGVPPHSAVAQVVTATPLGHLLRISLAPVRHAEAEDNTLRGYVLLVDDITRDQQQQARRERALLRMAEQGRASIANMQAALEMLDYPDLAPADHDRFLGVIRDEVARMRDRLLSEDEPGPELAARWPLHDMLATDLMAAAVRKLQATANAPITTLPVAEDLWLRIDSFGLIAALDHLATRILSLGADPVLWLRLTRAGGHAHLDLGWVLREGLDPIDARDLSALPDEPTEACAAASVRDVVDRHGGEIWLDRNRDDGRPFFRLLLPLAAVETAPADAPIGGRPEFYDFDLFAAAHAEAGDARPLSALAFTVFDCETTGLDPLGGDEIIQLGAVRILNSRLLTGETIDQLVDPQRPIPEAGIPIHGIRDEMVRGKPTIAQVLPVFHRFAEGSVLVGHNVAFDMRFLKLKEAATGLRFDHPVLDTLLLSSILHPAEESHSLEAIAARLGVQIGGRHTALGDALATAEVFRRMIPLLERQGIVTLGQARAASDRSQFARLRY
ncbi:3'-5' exonuclease [Paracoccus chinensis]|uniref:DNA-directed DNA polymerase n=1 Tax=Paracoccus chinensis TaxID=525640 RepID=A0A1G9F7W8_9RHOB|nr:exonuclease domain-containing protein [Paracoccus chinensis]SDK84527.1 DNA polymerase-3 subunit epsilon [Paracoccus chinensis]